MSQSRLVTFLLVFCCGCGKGRHGTSTADAALSTDGNAGITTTDAALSTDGNAGITTTDAALSTDGGTTDAAVPLGPFRGRAWLDEQTWPGGSKIAGFANFTVPAGPCPSSPFTSTCILTSDVPTGCGAHWGKDAGTVTVSGGKVSPITLKRVESPGYVHYSYVNDTLSDAFDTGDAIQIAASGNVLPAFSGTVNAPAPLAGLNPNPLSTTVHLSAVNPTTLQWLPGDGDIVLVGVWGGTPFKQVWCEADDIGSFDVPAAVGAVFPSGVTLQLQIARARRMQIPIGAGYVEIQARAVVQGDAIVP